MYVNKNYIGGHLNIRENTAKEEQMARWPMISSLPSQVQASLRAACRRGPQCPGSRAGPGSRTRGRPAEAVKADTIDGRDNKSDIFSFSKT